MKAGNFFARTWRILSVLGLLIALFTSYVSYPDEVAVRFDALKQPIQTIGREVIFYIAVAIFLVSNTLLNVIAKLFVRVPASRIPMPNASLWTTHRAALNDVFTNWFYALMAAINTILALGLFVLSLLNRGDRSMKAYDYAWLLPVSTAILIVVLVSLPVRLYLKPDTDA